MSFIKKGEWIVGILEKWNVGTVERWKNEMMECWKDGKINSLL
jgi:hypothetical protein